MTLTFRTKLLASHLGLVAAVVLVTILALNKSLGNDLVLRTDQRLERQARGAEVWLRRTRHPETLALRLAGVMGAHITIIDKTGKVVGDSGFPDVADPPVENQAAQPEVATALQGKTGGATRRDGDLDMHFVAVPLADDTVLRVGVPLSEITTTLREMRRRLLYAVLLGIAAALGLGLLASRFAAGPLRAMTESATQLAQGNYDIRLPAASPDEFGVLSRALESLATQLKARISDLTAERDRLSAILGSMIEGVLVVGADKRVVQANPSAARILGAEPPLGGKALLEVIHDPRVRSVVEEAVEYGTGAETEIDAPDRSLTMNLRPLQATPGHIVAVIHDVTRVRRLESMRRDFVANVSHELRTPVTAIQGYAETLLGDKADEAHRKQFLDIIHRHARRIGRLVEDLLKLSDLEARAPEQAVREAVAVTALSGQVVATVSERASKMEAKVTTDVSDDVVALGDPDWIEQVLENLVDNAIKYGKKGGKVAVTGRRHGDKVVLTVVDDGPGIDEQHLPRLFERFYRVDAGRSREIGGTGLGLAIVRQLVTAMNGTVSVASELGGGTRFTVTLPATRPAG